MIKVNSGGYNDIQYYSRYNRIDKYEILDHNSRIVESGSTSLFGYDGKINHTGITYKFVSNNLYTYKAYFISGGTYLAAHLYLKTIYDRLAGYKGSDRKSTFKVKEKFTPITGITSTTTTTTKPITTTTTTLLPYTTTTTTAIADYSFILEISLPTDNYIFTIPHLDGYSYDYNINWGDGNTGHVNSFDDPNATHTFLLAGVYNIIIDGICETLYTGFADYYFTKIIQWGNVGLKEVNFAYNQLTEIADDILGALQYVTNFSYTFLASPITSVPESLFAYAVDATTFSCTFQNTSLTSVPENLFKYNTNVTSFSGLFGFTTLETLPAGLFAYNTQVADFSFLCQYVFTLTSIPSNLFSNCNNVVAFFHSFIECVTISGNVPELWNMYPTADGSGCFYGCTNATNYGDIPAEWK